MIVVREYQKTDKDAVKAMNATIAGFREAEDLRLVAGEPAVAHLQIVDRATTAMRREGVCDFYLTVVPGHWQEEMATALYERMLEFARERKAHTLKTWINGDRDAVIAFFTQQGFVEIGREYPSKLDVTQFDISRFCPLLERLESEGVRFFRYADIPDTPENRRRHYELDVATRQNPSWGEDGPPLPDSFEPFASWEQDMICLDYRYIFLAEADGKWIGLTTRPDWPFTGVLPEYRGRGIAVALKALLIERYKVAGGQTMETENHAHNLPMLAVNRKLGYVFGTPSITLQKNLPHHRLSTS